MPMNTLQLNTARYDRGKTVSRASCWSKGYDVLKAKLTFSSLLQGQGGPAKVLQQLTSEQTWNGRLHNFD